MGDEQKFYRLVGSVGAGSRIDRVEVESPDAENPEGKVLTLHDPNWGLEGNYQPLSQEQVDKLQLYVQLEEVDPSGEAIVQTVDQPDLDRVSTSTDTPPDPGHTPTAGELEAMNGTELDAEIALVRERNPGALPDLKGNASLADKRAALLDYYQNQGA